MNMMKKLLKILDDDEDSHSSLEKTIAQLQEGIEAIDERLSIITDTAQTYHVKLGSYRAQKTNHLQKAQAHYKKKQESQALSNFKKVKALEDQITQYESLIQSIEDSKTTLFSRKNNLELKIDQLTAQLKLGEINADTSQIQAEVMEHLMLLENSGELSKYDDQLIESESRYQAMSEIAGIESTISPIETGISEMQDELSSIQSRASEDNLAKAKKKYSAFFNEESTNRSVPDQKAELLRQLRESVESNEKKLKTFFDTDKDSENSESQDRIKDFFGD